MQYLSQRLKVVAVVLSLAGAGALAQTKTASLNVGTYPVAIAVNPTTNRINVAHSGSAITVNTVMDEAAVNPATSDTTVDGKISLRSAIQYTNAQAGPDTIIVPAGTYNITISQLGGDSAATGNFDINDTLTIIGVGASQTIISGNGYDRVFNIGSLQPFIQVKISDLTITGGQAVQGDLDGGSGGGFQMDAHYVELDSVNVVGNAASDSGGGITIIDGTLMMNGGSLSNNYSVINGGGGAVIGGGTATFNHVSIDSNYTPTSGGGIESIGNAPNVSLNYCTFIHDSTASGNSGSGGAFANLSGNLTVNNCTILNCYGDNYGGGIYANAGSDTVSNTVIEHCHSSSGAGALYLDTGTGLSVLSYCTMDSNYTGYGGGAIVDYASSLTMTNDTIAWNFTTASGFGGGGGIQFGKPAVLSNVVVENNTGNNGAGIYELSGGGLKWTGGSLSNNTATGHGGGIYFYPTTANDTLFNVNISGNTPDSVYNANPGTYTVVIIFPGKPTISLMSPSGVTSTSATLNGKVTDDVRTAVYFLWGTISGVYHDSVAASPDSVSGDTATSVSANLTGLSQGTIYYAISASNSYGYFRGTENSLAIGSARWGDALSFATGQSAYYGNVLSTATSNVTLECWVKWNGTGGTNEGIIYNGNTGSSGYGIYVNTSDQLSILLGGMTYQASTDTLTPGVWTFLALVNSSGTWTLYRDGVNIVSTATTPAAPAGNFFVGGNYNGGSPSDNFNGTVDEVRFSSVARYTSNFARPTATFISDASTVGLYHFDEGYGSTTYDSSGNGYNLSLLNGPTWTSSDISLPVQATNFAATTDIGSVTLSWKTQSEVDNAGFNVLREISNGKMAEWQMIASYTSDDRLRGLGTSSTGRSYSFMDDHVVSGATYQYKIQSVSTNGNTKDLSTLSVTVDVPKTYALYQNYPNPFNPSTTVRFDLKEPSTVTLQIYNILGQKVEEWNYGMMQAGRFNESIDMSRCASGVYFYQITALGTQGQKFVGLKKLILLK
jgi:hypothetical protein